MGDQTYIPATPVQETPERAATDAQGTRQSAQDRLGNQFIQQNLPGPDGSGTCDPNEVKLPSPVAPSGALTYYGARHGDFASRYAGCGLTPPTYYLGYGEKYVGRFTNSTAPMLTSEGQAWLARARVNLQVAIENRRQADPLDFDRLEKNDGAFTSFAYGTHADAYWDAGLGELDLFDLATIGTTPDMRDLLAYDGLTQVADIGTRLLGTWGTDAIDWAAGEGTTEDLVNGAYEAFGVIGEDVDYVFGEGTTQSLLEGAESLGEDISVLTHDAYDYAAEQVSDTVDLIDSAMGEGWTEQTVDSGREWVQSGIDTVEGAYHDAEDWASEVWDDIF